ncbi:MAG: hypothetical protein JWQ38_1007 [Flavipsychrobacter sp.]|nr:hypothetical protein [Flavipsychrobacter sp.]
MRYLFLITCFFQCGIIKAQDYQCFVPGARQYFTNSNGYLRGIRIDSVNSYADSVLYFPFHTPRGRYMANSRLDSAGGSWVGKRVVTLNDGTYLFDNILGDTVVIKTMADAGDEWIFYNDAAELHYKAKVISVDTMTVLGTLDSVKMIAISAENSLGIVSSDPVNGFNLVLSKMHGFVQVFDLYTFPYHLPEALYTPGIDYYLDACSTDEMNEYHFGPSVTGAPPSSGNAIFNQINLINPINSQLNDWRVGDVYEYSECNGAAQWPSVICDPASSFYLDTVYSQVSSGSSSMYSTSGLRSDNHAFIGYGYTGYTDYVTYPNSEHYIFDEKNIIDTSKMPEEYGLDNILYYHPSDNSYCMVSPLYHFYKGEIKDYEYMPFFEGPCFGELYKQGPGLVSKSQISEVTGFIVTSKKLIYYKHDGVSCGGLHPLALGIKDIIRTESVSLSPNPATNEVNIQASEVISNVRVYDMYGRCVVERRNNSRSVSIDVSNLSPGVYTVRVNDSIIKRFVKE